MGAPLSAVPEAELLLRETARLTAREIAGALASIRIAALSDEDHDYRLNLVSALRQLESFSEYLELLVAEPRHTVRLDKAVHRLCLSIGYWKACHGPGTLQFALDPVKVDGATARRINLIVAELVGNAYRYGIEAGGETIRVELTGRRGCVSLAVRDDGPGATGFASAGPAPGLRLVSELAVRAGGSMKCCTEGPGTTFEVTIPVQSAREPT